MRQRAARRERQASLEDVAAASEAEKAKAGTRAAEKLLSSRRKRSKKSEDGWAIFAKA